MEKKRLWGKKIHIKSITEDHIDMTMTITFIDFKKKNTTVIKTNKGKPFSVSYFDSPFTDNSLMPDGDRISRNTRRPYSRSKARFCYDKDHSFSCRFCYYWLSTLNQTCKRTN